MNAENKKMLIEQFNTIDPIVAVQNHINWYKETGHKIMNYGTKQFMVYWLDSLKLTRFTQEEWDDFEYDTFTFLSPCIFDELNSNCKDTDQFEFKFINEICRLYPRMRYVIENRRPDILNSN